MSVTTKLEVEYSQFKKGMAEATASVNMLDAELKKNEAEFRANGDAEKYMADKADLLNQKLKAQQSAAKQAEQMFLNLAKRGVSPTSVEYQRMATKMINAQAAVASTQAELNKLNEKQTSAAKSAGDLATNVEKIGKNVSLQTLTDGLSKVTNGMEKAYRTAVRFGRAVVRSAMDATGWADDVATRAVQYGVDAETIQKMDQVAAYIDTDVDTIISAKDRMSKNKDKVSELLGISTDGRTVDDVFWEAGEAIKNLGEGFDQNDYAMQIFGRGWRELLPLITAGREQYEALMESQNVLSNEQVQKLQEADDAFQSIQQEVANLKREFWANNAGTVIELLQWIVDNKETVVGALTAIAGAFAALKTAETAANIMKIVNGLKGLTGGSAATNGATNGMGLGGKLLATGVGVKLTGVTAGAGAALTMFDPTGLTALIPSVMEDQTEFFRMLRNGGTIEEAAKAEGKAVKQAAKNAVKAWGDWGNQMRDTSGNLAHWIWTSVFGSGNKDEKAEVKVEPKTEEDAAAMISAQIGTVSVPVRLYLSHAGGSAPAGGGGGGGLSDYFYDTLFGSYKPGFANGIPWVNDTQLAWLHRGERVLTASQNRSYTANSNLYVENMHMGGGMDAQALAEAMSAQNRRISAGFGS